MFADYEYIYIDISLMTGTQHLQEFFKNYKEQLIEQGKLVTIFAAVIGEAWDICMEDSKAYENMLFLEKNRDILFEFDYTKKYRSLEALIADRVGKMSQLLITRNVEFAKQLLKLNESVDSDFLSVGLVNDSFELDVIKASTNEDVSDFTENQLTLKPISVPEPSTNIRIVEHQFEFQTPTEVMDEILRLEKRMNFLFDLYRRMIANQDDENDGLSA